MLVRMWSNKNSHSLLVGMQNSTATLEGSLAVGSFVTNLNILFIRWSSNKLLGIYPKELKTYPPKNLLMGIHSIFIYNIYIQIVNLPLTTQKSLLVVMPHFWLSNTLLQVTRQALIGILSLQINLHFYEFYVSTIIDYILFFNVASLTLYLEFIHIVVCVNSTFLFIVE